MYGWSGATYGLATRSGNARSCTLDGFWNFMPYIPLSRFGCLRLASQRVRKFWPYNPSSSKDLTEYNGELGSACKSCSLTATSYLLWMRFVSRSFASFALSSVANDGISVVAVAVALAFSWLLMVRWCFVS